MYPKVYLLSIHLKATYCLSGARQKTVRSILAALLILHEKLININFPALVICKWAVSPGTELLGTNLGTPKWDSNRVLIPLRIEIPQVEV
jgi:hypothetical protein